MTQLRKKPRSVPPALLAEIREMGERGITGAEISRTFETRAAVGAPSLRTIQDILREDRTSDASGDWSVATSDPDQIATVLEVLRAVIEETEGRRRSLTGSEADWSVRIRAAAPDLPAWDVYRLARFYLRLGVRGESTNSLDAYLAFGGWRTESQNIYHAAIAAEWVAEPPGEIVYPMTRDEIHKLAERWADEWMQRDGQSVAEMRAAGLSEEDARGVLIRSIQKALLDERDPDDLHDMPFQSLRREGSLRDLFADVYRELVDVFVRFEREARKRVTARTRSDEELRAQETAIAELRAAGVSDDRAAAAVAELRDQASEQALQDGMAMTRAALPAPIRPWLDDARRVAARRQEIPDAD